MVRLWVAALALLLAAPCAFAQGPWTQTDPHSLEGDQQHIERCLAEDDAGYSCVGLVQSLCYDDLPEDFASGASDRACNWRALAAWEALMAASLKRLAAALPDGAALDAAQAAWERAMLADVGLESDLYRGGSLMGVVAARARSDATALRVLRLRQILQTVE
jgi:hypothetical protein